MPRVKGLDRAAIARAAADLADQVGDIHTVTLAQIAAHFGIRLPSLYNHISNLDQVRLDVAVLALRDLTTVLQTACAGRAQDDGVRQLLRAYRRYALEHPGRYSAALLRGDERADWVAAGEAVVALVGQLLEPYGLSKTERIHAIRGLRSLAHGFASLEAGRGFGLPVNTGASFDHLISVYLRGLRGT